MSPLAAIYRPGGSDLNGYPVTAVDFITNWSEQAGAVTEVVCVVTDGAIRTFPLERVQIVDRSVAAVIVAATEVYQNQRGQQGTVPPQG
jgi:hypothetical protein